MGGRREGTLVSPCDTKLDSFPADHLLERSDRDGVGADLGTPHSTPSFIGAADSLQGGRDSKKKTLVGTLSGPNGGARAALKVKWI